MLTKRSSPMPDTLLSPTDELTARVGLLEQRVGVIERFVGLAAPSMPVAIPQPPSPVASPPAPPPLLPIRKTLPVRPPENRGIDLETTIGRNWTSWVGGVVVVLGVVFFIKYAWYQGWLAMPRQLRVFLAI